MKKLFALVALVIFIGAIASPTVAAAYSAPITIKVADDKPKKAKPAAETQKKADCPAEKKGDCSAGEKKACCESKKECSGGEKK